MCEPCDSACEKATTMMTPLETTQIATLPSTSSVSSNSETTELRITTTDLKDETTLETKSTDASCALPEDLKNTVWEYNYTDVAANSEQSTNLYIANTTLPNSVINLNDGGSVVNNWTCINSLTISDTSNVVVFKSDASFPLSGGSRRLYLCMKFTKVTTDLFYFHLLSATTMMSSLETTQIHTMPSTSTEIDITTDRTATENTQKTSKPATSDAIDTTTDVMSTVTTQITTLSSTSTEIDSTTEITIIKTPETTLQTTSTPTEMDSLTESTTTAPKTTLHTTSTAMDTTLQLKSTDTTQTTAVHSTSTDLKTSTQTTIPSASTNRETTTELKVTTTDLKDETTLETKLTDTENLKRYSGPITLVGISCAGFVLVIIILCLLKGTSKNSTEEIANNGEEKAYAPSPENCYKLYKGKQFGLQEIAIRHWDYH
ncbi:mucin-5AC-like [Mytilus trossulus]|uniref:mucin-5AC-like n=1 Tax=Mytilus trossulus TaxID=6551 RepID=UPI003004473C